jgi:hypothetical protein
LSLPVISQLHEDLAIGATQYNCGGTFGHFE